MQCFKCGKTLEKVFEDSEHQPYDACNFSSQGHYGSRVFDPMKGADETLLIHICDDCLIENKSLITLFEKNDQPDPTYTASPWEPEI